MSASTTKTTNGRSIGTTTIGASGGALGGYGVGKAIAAILVHFFPGLIGIEWAVELLIEAALVVAGGILGGKISPTNMAKIITEYIEKTPTSEVTPQPANISVEAETVHVEEKSEVDVDTTTEDDSIEFIER